MSVEEEYEVLVQKDYTETDSREKEDQYDEEADIDLEIYDDQDVLQSAKTDVDVDLSLEKSKEDLADEEEISKLYIENAENCCEKKCNKNIPKEVALKHRYNFMEMTKKDQDLAICAHFALHRRIPELKNEYGQSNSRGTSKLAKVAKLTRHTMQYFFADLIICRKMYFFLYDIKVKRYKNVQKHYDNYGLSGREHKLTNTIPTRQNLITSHDITNIVTFIKNYARRVAIPLPGRLPQFKNYVKVLKLPSSVTRMSLFREFCNAVNDEDVTIRLVSRITFCKIWNDYCPDITVMKPATDLCDTCRTNHLNLRNISQMSVEEQATTLKTATEHVEVAQKQRQYYNSWREQTKITDTTKLAVFSFDYAQNVSYPSSPQQVGSSYFKANRKCGIFGLHNEKTGVQTNVLIDEGDNAGKGANAVISMLDYYLNTITADNIVMFADNCVGQNKNNAVVHYLLWRVMTGKCKAISLNFLLTGHTKFSPDRNFGIMKSKYGKSIVDCQEDFIEVVKISSPNGFNSAIPSYDPSTNTRNIRWAEWDVFLKQYFKPVSSLTKFHHFDFFPNGRITAKLFADSPEIIVQQKKSLDVVNVTPLKDIVPEGLSPQRAWYLYDEIRPLCQKEISKNLVAPKPLMTKPKRGKRDT